MQTLRPVFRGPVAVAASAAISLPLGFVATLFLLPFWRWLESAHGIESVGHSGPADWCFSATILAVFVPVLALALRIAWRKGGGTADA